MEWCECCAFIRDVIAVSGRSRKIKIGAARGRLDEAKGRQPCFRVPRGRQLCLRVARGAPALLEGT